MSNPITIQLPEEVLIKALQQLSPERRRQILQQVETRPQTKIVTFSKEALYHLTGIIEVGGDALEDSERLYDE